MRLLKAIAALLCGISLLAGPVAAQVPDPFARQLAEHLARVDSAVAEEGFARVAGPFSAAAPAGSGEAFTVTLRAGREYFVAAVCDDRCGGLALRVRDPGGGTIAGGAGARLRPNITGSYTIEADVTRCSADVCWVALNVYAR
ncbi:MAG: hypothetical protein K2P58_00120 [Hyphomonadaceae bacterium]|nr:hypothetical protein [Hyphomonadaceae bacterium]